MSSDPLNIGDTEVANLNITGGRQRRIRRCGICRQEGHDRRSCPSSEAVELRRIAHERRVQEAQQRHQEQLRLEQEKRDEERRRGIRRIRLFNDNNYDITFFWAYHQENPPTKFKYLGQTGANTDYGVKSTADTVLLVVPTIEIPNYIDNYESMNGFDRANATRNIDLDSYDGFIVGKYRIKDFDHDNIHIIADELFKPKSLVDQWKECGLKAVFLLKELNRLGASQNENLEAIMDMVQDIRIPSHSQLDRENAGIPSVFTNIT